MTRRGGQGTVCGPGAQTEGKHAGNLGRKEGAAATCGQGMVPEGWPQLSHLGPLPACAGVWASLLGGGKPPSAEGCSVAMR